MMKIQFNSIKFIMLCQLWYAPYLLAGKIPEDFKQFSSSIYNRLPLSAEADNELKKNGRLDKFLEDALPIAEKYDLTTSLGFRLLHRHETIREEKIMVESFGYWRETPAFITTLEQEGIPRTYPASWMYEASGLKVFEFSTDPRVKQIAKKLVANPSFFEEMKSELVKHQLQTILAPAILARSSFVHFDEAQPLYEIIRPQPYASVLINKSLEEINKEAEKGVNLVRTTWSLGDKQRPGVRCATFCHASTEDWKWHIFDHE